MTKITKNIFTIDSKKEKTVLITGVDLLDKLHTLSEIQKYSKFLLLSDKKVFNLFGQKVVRSLKKLGKEVVVLTIPEGEKMKNMQTVKKIVEYFFASKINRKSVLVNLGGGVITDIGGFVSSIILRGIPAINIPTTLLSQVDASLGGKTGVNLHLSKSKMYKNMIGTFHQPDLVVTDVATLGSLPKKEILNGMGELVKYAVGFKKPSFEELEKIKQDLKKTKDKNLEEISEIIKKCQEVKLEIVKKDPFDTSLIREKLNFGHTIGHAIEANNKNISHGQSVAIGIVASLKISLLKGLITESLYQNLVSEIKSFGLATKTAVDEKKVLETLATDKKGGRFVLIENIGKLKTNMRIDKKIIKKALKEIIKHE